jgi:serine phosphatase RsbU (regulator of sigma subunit)/CHASE1-domain containing sensor protein
MVEFARKGDRRARGAQLTALLLTLAVGLIVLGVVDLRRERSAHSAREHEALVQVEAIVDAIDRELSGLGVAQLLVEADGTVDPLRFQVFASSLLERASVSSVAYEPVVQFADRADFEATHDIVISERGPDGAFIPAAVRPLYHPVTHVSPLSIRSAVGFDVSSDEVRRAAVEGAAATGQPVATTVLELAPGATPGVLTFTPLFRVEGAGNGRTEVVGFISVGYFTSDLLRNVRTTLDRAMRYTIEDDGVQLVGNTAGDFTGQTATVEVAGRSWLIRVGLASPSIPRTTVTTMLAGLVLIGVIGVSGLRALRQQTRLERAEQRTAALQQGTASLTRCNTPAEVGADAVATVRSMLGANTVGWVVTTRQGERISLHTAPRHTCDLWRPDHPAPGMTRTVFPVDDEDWSQSCLIADTDGPVEAADVELCRSYTTVMGAALRRAKRHELEHHLAEAMQRQLLVAPSRSDHHFEIAAEYRPAHTQAQVGGDWFDTVPLEPGLMTITVGDVVGHGIAAATAMGQMRIAARALATAEPSRVLDELDRLAPGIANADCATCAVTRLDVTEGRLSHASAGHPPTLLLRDMVVTPLWTGRGPPIGLTEHSRTSGEHELRVGDRIVMYTDGLIERRSRTVDEGIELLSAAVRATATETSCNAVAAILDQLEVEPRRDDVAIVVVTVLQ